MVEAQCLESTRACAGTSAVTESGGRSTTITIGTRSTSDSSSWATGRSLRRTIGCNGAASCCVQYLFDNSLFVE